MVMIGLGLSLLTILRGLSTNVQIFRVGVPSKALLPVFFPPIWPARNVRISIYLDSGEVDLLILDERGYRSFLEANDLEPLREFSKLRSDVLTFETPSRGQYYIVLRNDGMANVDGEMVLTFWGFETDLLLLSAMVLVLGAAQWVGSYFVKKQQRKSVA